MKLEWKFGEADCELGHYTIRMNREGSFDAQFVNPQECTMIAIQRITKAEALVACESHYSARIDALARANGYVKLEPGQVVVDAKPIIERCEACDEEGLKVVCDGMRDGLIVGETVEIRQSFRPVYNFKAGKDKL